MYARNGKCFGFPMYLSFPRGATNQDVHNLVWEHANAILPEGHTFTLEDPPYKLLKTNAKSTNEVDPVPVDEEVRTCTI